MSIGARAITKDGLPDGSLDGTEDPDGFGEGSSLGIPDGIPEGSLDG